MLLMVFFTDKKIEWYESLILLCLYGLYVIFMSRNVQVYGAVRGFLDKRSGKVAPETKNRRNTLLEKGEAGSGMASVCFVPLYVTKVYSKKKNHLKCTVLPQTQPCTLGFRL